MLTAYPHDRSPYPTRDKGPTEATLRPCRAAHHRGRSRHGVDGRLHGRVDGLAKSRCVADSEEVTHLADVVGYDEPHARPFEGRSGSSAPAHSADVHERDRLGVEDDCSYAGRFRVGPDLGGDAVGIGEEEGAFDPDDRRRRASVVFSGCRSVSVYCCVPATLPSAAICGCEAR